MDDEHKQKHIELHYYFQELLSEFFVNNPRANPSETSVLNLLVWSGKQVENPDHDK